MDFITFAMGSPPGGGEGGGIGSFLPMFAIIMLIFYFLIMRPEQKKKKEAQETLKSIKKGDKVVTSSGIIGIIAGVKENSVMLKVADNVKIEVLRSSIGQVLDKDEPTSS